MASQPQLARDRVFSILTLLAFLLSFLAVQVACVQLGNAAVAQSGGGWDLHSLWQAYLRQRPEVLFIGDSRTRHDVNVAEVSRLLSSHAGRLVTVGKFGISNGKPRTLASVMFRLSRIDHPPRVVFWNVSEYAFNENFPWYGANSDLYSMNDPFDPAYMLYPYSIDPQRPAAARPCDADVGVRGGPLGRLDMRAARPAVVVRDARPSALSGSPVTTAECHGQPYTDGMVDIVMTDATRAQTYAMYHDEVISNWSFSERQATLLGDGVGRARKAGINVALWVPPTFHLDSQAPAIYSEYLAQVSAVAAAQKVPLFRSPQ